MIRCRFTAEKQLRGAVAPQAVAAGQTHRLPDFTLPGEAR
jgi:hypothetical protein